MVPLKILTLIVTGPHQPSVLVLEPIEEGTDGKSRIVPIWIGPNEATQLGIAIEHLKLPRPTTHDLFLDAVTNLDARIDHMEITDVKNQTFFAKLFIRQGDRLVELDARPTDALALTLRQGEPFYIDEDVLERASYPFIFKSEESKQIELDEFRSFLESIGPDDFQE